MAPRLCLTVATLHACIYMRKKSQPFWVGNWRVAFLTLNSAQQLSRCRFLCDQKECFYTSSHLFSCCPFHPTLFRCAWNISFYTNIIVSWRSADGDITSVHIPSLMPLVEYFLVFYFVLVCLSSALKYPFQLVWKAGIHFVNLWTNSSCAINPTVETWVRMKTLIRNSQNSFLVCSWRSCIFKLG